MRFLNECLLPQASYSCHASTILPLGDRVLCAWFSGTAESEDDVEIYLCTLKSGKWGVPEKMSCGKPEPYWNPVLYKTLNGQIMLFYKYGRKIPTWQTFFRYTDDIVNWSDEKELVPGDIGGRGPVKNKPITLKDGRIIAPASLEDGMWRCFADISSDGLNWTMSNIINANEKGVIQPTLWQDDDGIHMFMRSNAGFIYRSDSKDGVSWGEAYATDLPNNNSGIDLTRTANGDIYLVLNPISGDFAKRSPISLMVSHDNAKTFEKLADLSDGDGEFSYPAICTKNDIIYITYTYKREFIKYWEIQI